MMKRILVLLVILTLAVVATNAQKTTWLMGLSKDSAKVLCDDIVSNMRGAFKFKYAEPDTLNNRPDIYYFYYKSDSIKTDASLMTITFDVRNEGGNQALEIQGSDRYYLRSLIGKYLDVFPFWKEYVDPNADKIELSKKSISTTKKIYYPNDPKNNFRLVYLIPSEDKSSYDIEFKF